MRNIWFVVKTWLTSGNENQSFIGARWLVWVLQRIPTRWQRPAALRVLALSPHYFYLDHADEYQRMSRHQILEAEYERNKCSRQRLRDEILSDFLNAEYTVLDYGCGPGFLAKAVANKVRKIHAIDISRGVLACAGIINPAPNLTYRHADDIDQIEESSIDLVYSFAVIQHVTDEVFEEILRNAARLLKPGGQLVAHIVLEPEGWRDQQSWEADTSLSGRVKLKYGLNCFSRTDDSIKTQTEAANFIQAKITPVSEWCPEVFDDICEQHLLTARLAD